MAEYSIDDLAARAGLPSSTIRMYVQRGLLGRPARRGRNAVYGPGHVERLAGIRRLQERGFSLAAIQQVFEMYDRGEDLPSLIDGGDAEPVQLDAAAFAELLFPGGEADPEVLRAGQEAGILTVDDDGVRFTDRRHLRAALRVAELGIPPLDMIDAWRQLRAGMDELAGGLAAIVGPLVAEVDDAARLVSELRALTEELVVLAFREALARKLDDLGG